MLIRLLVLLRHAIDSVNDVVNDHLMANANAKVNDNGDDAYNVNVYGDARANDCANRNTCDMIMFCVNRVKTDMNDQAPAHVFFRMQRLVFMFRLVITLMLISMCTCMSMIMLLLEVYVLPL